MVKSMVARFESYKRWGNELMDYDDILLFYPDYYKTKVELENMKFITKEETDEYFEKNYKNSELYKTLTELAMAEEDIYEFMKHNKDLKYNALKKLFEARVSSSITLCELIDYIGHYPDTFPVPTEEEKNPKMEELFEKYDIVVRYYMHDDIDRMQIVSNDVVRIIEKLQVNLYLINDTLDIHESLEGWLLCRTQSDKELIEMVQQEIESIEKFPLSKYQLEGKSRREEGKKIKITTR